MKTLSGMITMQSALQGRSRIHKVFDQVRLQSLLDKFVSYRLLSTLFSNTKILHIQAHKLKIHYQNESIRLVVADKRFEPVSACGKNFVSVVKGCTFWSEHNLNS